MYSPTHLYLEVLSKVRRSHHRYDFDHLADDNTGVVFCTLTDHSRHDLPIDLRQVLASNHHQLRDHAGALTAEL